MARFERRFTGKANAGLRKAIRDAADGVQPACGPATAKAVEALAGRIALTASGRVALAAAAADYRAARGESDSRCDCYACTQGSLQRLGALG